MLKFTFLIILPIDETLTLLNQRKNQCNGQGGGGGNIVYLSLDNENMATLQHNRERHLLISFSDLVRFPFLQPSSPLPPFLFRPMVDPENENLKADLEILKSWGGNFCSSDMLQWSATDNFL